MITQTDGNLWLDQDLTSMILTFPVFLPQKLADTLSDFSSRGPSLDGRIKPDITATGEITLSCIIVARIQSAIHFIPYKVAQDSFHIRDGGTSSASPVVAAIAGGKIFFFFR